MISEIRNLCSYLCKPVSELNFERPRTPSIKSDNSFGTYTWIKEGKVAILLKYIHAPAHTRARTHTQTPIYIYIYIYIYTPGYIITLEIMLLLLWRFDPIPCHGLASLGITIILRDTPRSVGLLWMGDQLDARTLPDNAIHSQQTAIYVHWWDSNPQTQKWTDADPRPRPCGSWDRQGDVRNVNYIWIVHRVIYKLCSLSVSTSRDNDFVTN